ncbi:hypothetical protein A8B76_25245 [Roseovarius indicus]|nr:hypothetical protein A8B76_25245 [Roseovarius indicus]
MKLGDRLFNRFYRFAVVRNPHDRAYSLYSYCVQRLKNNPDFQAHLAGMDVHSADWAEISAEFWKRAGIHPDDAQSVVAKKNYPEEISFMESGIFRWNANRAVLTSPDFDACVQNEFFQRDAGFRPQANMLYDQKTGELLVPNLVKMEELRDNWPKLRKRLGVDAELPHENVSGTKENAPIAPSTMAFLREWFAQDYELLGY